MGPGKRTEPHTRPPSHGGLDHGEAQLHGDHQKGTQHEPRIKGGEGARGFWWRRTR